MSGGGILVGAKFSAPFQTGSGPTQPPIKWVEYVWNVMTRAENRFRLSTKRTSPFKSARGGGGGQFSRLLAGELCTPACRVCTARASLCSAVTWRLLATHSIRQFPLHFSTSASPCAITFQLDSTLFSFLAIKRPKLVVDHPPTSSAEVKGRVELYSSRPLDFRGLFLGVVFI
jgi:hypothetical protein